MASGQSCIKFGVSEMSAFHTNAENLDICQRQHVLCASCRSAVFVFFICLFEDIPATHTYIALERSNGQDISLEPTLTKDRRYPMNAETSYNFAESFAKLSGVVHEVSSEQAAADKIVSIFKSKDAKCVALAGLSGSLVAEIENRCSGMTVLKDPYRAETLPGAIDEADVGVTGISFAIAQSGTLVEISTDDAVRLVSGLPRTYIGVLHAQDVVDKYDDGPARIREIVKQHDENLVISFISGPSRTGDIELKLTLGVHGPEEAHAVIIGRQS